MGYTLESFASECHDILADDPGVAGREKVRDLLKQVLVDSTFVAENFSENNDAPRSILYEDDKWALRFAHMSISAKRCPNRTLTVRIGRSMDRFLGRRRCSTINLSIRP